MINGDIDQFLDTGWFSEATLYLNGYTYWCEGCWAEETREKPMHFTVQKYKSCVVDDCHTKCYVYENGEAVDFEYVIDDWFYGEDDAKKFFLESKFFEGKTFWEVESTIAWYDEIGSTKLK